MNAQVDFMFLQALDVIIAVILDCSWVSSILNIFELLYLLGFLQLKVSQPVFNIL